MAHVTFVHGIDNKPPARELRQQWLDALADESGINLDEQGITSSMVYWADVLYADPLEPETNESFDPASEEQSSEIIQQLASAVDDPNEARFLAGVAGKLSIAALKSSVAIGSASEERIPLPWSIKQPAMEILLRDVHHYLFNEEFSPRAGDTYRVRDEIRRRFVETLTKSASLPGPHIVVSHSMGTVIAYDCLRRVPSCPRVEGLMTAGSPLGLDEIQDQLQPEWTRRNGFPERTIEGSWLNVFDPLDPVAAFDPYLANDFRLAGRRVVRDIKESNWGTWRHSINKYLAGPLLRNGLRSMLGLATEDTVPSTSTSERAAVAEISRRRSPIKFVSYPAIERLVATLEVSKNRRKSRQVTESQANRGKKPDSEAKELRAEPGLTARLNQALQAIRGEAEVEGYQVMTSPAHRDGAVLQSCASNLLAQDASSTLEEFPFDADDTKKVLRDLLPPGHKVDRHPLQHPKSATPDPIPATASVFLVSDFGTGLYGAPVIANNVAKRKFDLLLHLGDIYYSGQKDEVRSRFLDIWPKSAGDISRALNGNHDMYSGGFGYFDVVLPAFSQSASYFAYQNKHWLLVMLDTAYDDNDLDSKQVQWITEVVSKSRGRRLVLFSHHPLFSNFKPQGTAIAEKLAELLKEQRITAWYWGHEHHAVIYDPHPSYGLHARCLGNGGMPAKRDRLSSFPVEKKMDRFAWRRCNSVLTPSAVFLDGPNPFIKESPDEYGPHGFMTLDLEGPSLTEKVYSADGQLLFKNVIH